MPIRVSFFPGVDGSTIRREADAWQALLHRGTIVVE
jgi:hypothetical protein